MSFEHSRLVELACLWEATVPKPGNVHPKAAFEDMCYQDFVRSANAIVPVFAHSDSMTVGELILEAVRATKLAVGMNTNLGMVLILAPLAKAYSAESAAVQQVLHDLTVHDASLAYQAIRLAQAGGMGKVESQDVMDEPTITLFEAMQMAAGRDLIAKQYATGYQDIYRLLLPALEAHLPESPELGIQHAFLLGLAHLGDTLITRKCGTEIAEQAEEYAQNILELDYPHTIASRQAYALLDDWLRADGHCRNPGTMADLIAGTLFLALRRGTMPARFP